MKINLLLSILILSLAAVTAAAQGESFVFKGSVGESRIDMTLVRNGDALSGSYSYVKVGKPIALSGSVEADGKFSLSESAAGVKSGSFSGTWTATDSGVVTLNGEWRNPGGTKTLSFDLSQQMIFFSGNAKISGKLFTESSKPKMFDITVEYPEVSGVAPAVAAEFNRLAKLKAMNDMAEFRKAMLAQTAEDLKWSKERGMNNYSETYYSITYADDEVISVWYGNSSFSGGAHPNSNSFTLNFDLKTGREISIGDLFKPNSKYLQVLSTYCVQELKKEVEEASDDEWIRNGAGPKAENYRSWNISKNGIVVNFDAYQVAAYVAGPQEVVVPFAELRSIFGKSYQILNR